MQDTPFESGIVEGIGLPVIVKRQNFSTICGVDTIGRCPLMSMQKPEPDRLTFSQTLPLTDSPP
jgi:hypothetical protein